MSDERKEEQMDEEEVVTTEMLPSSAVMRVSTAEEVDEWFAMLDSIPMVSEIDDWDTTELNEMVQLLLRDSERPSTHRALEAAAVIEARVRTHYNVDWEIPLPIPPEWAHRVPA